MLSNMFHPLGFFICSNEEDQDFKFIFKSLSVGLLDINMPMQVENLI